MIAMLATIDAAARAKLNRCVPELPYQAHNSIFYDLLGDLHPMPSENGAYVSHAR